MMPPNMPRAVKKAPFRKAPSTEPYQSPRLSGPMLNKLIFVPSPLCHVFLSGLIEGA